jgi:menaquinone-dependent protoporphyrinogen oxidase
MSSSFVNNSFPFEEKTKMKYLIVYATTEGQTRKIALYMKECLTEIDHTVTIADASDSPPAPNEFDAVIIGASIHMHKYQTAVVHYIKHYADILNKMPSAFFSVCLAVASEIKEEHKEAENITLQLLEQTGWAPLMTKQIAGALKYTEYDFFKRLIMKMIAKKERRPTDTSHDYEYTNWEEVKKCITEFANGKLRK